MADDIAPLIQDISHAVISHGQINHNIRQKVGADTAIDHPFKAAVGQDRYFKQKDHLLAIAHDIGNIGLHGCPARLEIVLVAIADASGGETVRIHLSDIEESVAGRDVVPDRAQIWIRGLRFAEYFRGRRLGKRCPVVIHPPADRVRSYLRGRPQGFFHQGIDAARIQQGGDCANQNRTNQDDGQHANQNF